MAARRPPPFSPSLYTPEKRVRQYTLRLTDQENEILERKAQENGLTALNMMRAILSEALSPAPKRRR